MSFPFTPGADIVQWLMKNLCVEDPGRSSSETRSFVEEVRAHRSAFSSTPPAEAIHLGSLIAAHGYIFPISDHVLTLKDDGTLYRFQVWRGQQRVNVLTSDPLWFLQFPAAGSGTFHKTVLTWTQYPDLDQSFGIWCILLVCICGCQHRIPLSVFQYPGFTPWDHHMVFEVHTNSHTATMCARGLLNVE